MRHRRIRRNLLKVPFQFEHLESRHLLATLVWDGGGDGRLWSNALNWNGNVLPSAGDDVIIPDLPGTASIAFDSTAGEVILRNLDSDEPFVITGGSLNVTEGATFGSQLTISGGTLQGRGSMAVQGRLTWSGGTIRGSSTVESLRVEGGMTINSGLPSLHGRRLELASDTVWSAGELRLSGGAEVHNLAGSTFDVRADVTLRDNDAASTDTFSNWGMVRKSGGTLASTWLVNVRNEPTGTIHVQQGQFTITGSTASEGHWQLDANTQAILRNNTHQFSAGTTATGTGRFWLDNSTLDIVSDVTLDAGFEFSSGRQQGAGKLTLAGPVIWRGGELRGTDPSQVTRITGGLQITGGLPTLHGRRLELASDTVWTAGELRMSGGAELHNLKGSTFDVRADVTLRDNDAANTDTFSNWGTVRKSGGGLASTWLVNVRNEATGTIHVQQGQFTITGSAASEGHWQLEANTQAILRNNTHQFSAGTTSTGMGRFWIDNSTLDIVSDVTLDTGFEFSSGRQQGAGKLTLAGPVVWRGGEMRGTNATQVTRITGGLQISGGLPTVHGRRLELASDTVWTAGELRMSGAAEMHNLAGSTFDVRADVTLRDNDAASTDTFSNWGTVRKSGGGRASTWLVNVRNEATGTIHVQQGQFAITGSAASEGHWQLDANTQAILRNNTHQFSVGTTSAGAGRIWVDNATLDIVADVTLDSGFEFSSGRQQGAGKLTLAGPVLWRGGELRGTDPSQVTRITGGLQITGGLPTVHGRRLELASDTVWTAGELRMSGGAEMHNLAGSTFDIPGIVTLRDNSAGTTETFYNFGSFVTSVGTLNRTIQADFVNQGTIALEAGGLVATRFQQSGGQTFLNGRTLQSSQQIEILEGVLYGPGTITGSLTNQGKIVPHDEDLPGQLTISGSYLQGAKGRLEIKLFGPLPGEQDRLAVNQIANLDGALRLTRSSEFEPALGSAFDVVTYASHIGEFETVLATVGAGKSTSVSYGTTTATVQIVEGALEDDAEFTRLELNSGWSDLRNQIVSWSGFFDLDNQRLPLIEESLPSLFGLPDQLSGLASQYLAELTSPTTQYIALRQALEAAGLTVLCVATEPTCDAAGEQLRVRWDYETPSPAERLSGTATFDDDTAGLLQGVANSTGFVLGGSLSASSDLLVSLIFGVDENGFFLVGGDSRIDLRDLTIDGDVAGNGQVGGGADVTFAGQMSSQHDVGLILGAVNAKYRDLGILPLDLTVAGPNGNGHADLSLEFQVGPAEFQWQSTFATTKAAGGALQVTMPTVDFLGELTLPSFEQIDPNNGALLSAHVTVAGVCSQLQCAVTGAAEADVAYRFAGFSLQEATFAALIQPPINATDPGIFSGTFGGTLIVDFGNAAGDPTATIPFNGSFGASQLHVDALVIPPSAMEIGTPPALVLQNPEVELNVDITFAQPLSESEVSVVVSGRSQQALLFPNSATTATVSDDNTSDDLPAIEIVLDGRNRRLSADLRMLNAQQGEDLQLIAGPLSFDLGLNDPPETPVLQGANAKFFVSSIDPTSPLELNVDDFVLTRGGDFRFSSATAEAQAGVLTSFGLAGLLPFDVTRVTVASAIAGQPVDLNSFAVDIRVEGFFDFALWTAAGLPQPIVQVGDTANEFDVVFRLSEGQVVLWQTGPITVGFANLELDPLRMSTSLTLNGISAGVFDSGFTIDGQLTDSDGAQLATVSSEGNLQLGPDSTTLDATVSIMVAGPFGVPDLIDFRQLTGTFQTHLEVNPATGQLIDARMNLIDAAVGQIDIHLGSLVTLRGTNVSVDFQAPPGEPFVYFGGDSGSLTGGVEVVFSGGEDGGPLDGLGGQVGNFAFGWDPESVLGVRFEQLEDFYFKILIPEGFKFGLPDWLPVEVREIGLAFGAVLFGDDEFSPSLDDLSQVSLTASGGLAGNSEWPITAQFEDMQIDLQRLKACGDYILSQAADAIPEGGTSLDAFQSLGLALLQHCEMPITNLDALELALEPIEIGGVSIGGGLGFGLLDVLVDTNQDGVGDREESVLYGRILGEFAYSETGVGVELILTEFGPVLGRLYAGVPVPIGGLIGAVVGVFFFGVGAAAGYQVGDSTGFIVSGFEGGMVFGEDPLPTITDPQQILEDSLNEPLKITLDNVLGKVRQVAQDRYDVLHDNDPLNDAPVYTWDDGFTLAFSGVLTNRYVSGLIGLEGTFGMNVGYGSPETTGIQLFGYGDLVLSGIDLARSGVLLDVHLDDPFSPTLNAAFSIPGGESNPLRLLFPASGDAGMRLETTGLFQGTIAGMRELVEGIYQNSLQYGGALFSAMMARVAEKLDQSRQAWLDAPPDARPPVPRLLRYINGRNDAATLTSTVMSRAITSTFLLERARSILRTVDQLPTSPANTLARAAFLGEALLNEMLLAGQEIIRQVETGELTDANLSEVIALLNSNADLLSQLQRVADRLQPSVPWDFVVPPPDSPEGTVLWPLLPGRQQTASELQSASQTANQLFTLFLLNMQNTLLASAAKFYTVINPSLTITGALQPTIMGVPIGEPVSEVGIRLDKTGLQFSADTSVGQLFNAAGIVQAVLGGPNIPIGADVGLPIGEQLLDVMFTEEQFPPLTTSDPNWFVALSTGLQVAHFDVITATGLMIPPPAGTGVPDPQWKQQVQQVWIEPELDLERIPIFEPARYEALEDYGGILLTGLLRVPHLLVDPVDVLTNLPALPENPLEYPGWLSQLAGQLSQVDTPGRIQTYLPSPTTALKAPIPPGEEVCQVLLNPSACVFDRAKLAEIQSSAFLEGAYSGKLLGLELGTARIEGQLNAQGLPELSVMATDPWLGAELQIQIGYDQRTITPVGGPALSVEFPIASGELTLNGSEVEELLDQLAIPNQFLPLSTISDASGSIRAFSPGYSNAVGETDLLKKLGGVEFRGEFQVDAFGSLSAQFAGSTDTLGSISFRANDVQFGFAAPAGFGLPPVGQISAVAELSIEQAGFFAPLQIGGTFAGSMVVANEPVVSVMGQIDSQGCLSGHAALTQGSTYFEHSLVPGACLPHLQIHDATVTELDEDVTLHVTVELSRPWQLSSGIPVNFQYEIGILPVGTATSRAGVLDFAATLGSKTIPAGQTTVTIPVTIRGDDDWENAEQFRVRILSATSAVVADPEAIITIQDDDLANVVANVLSAIELSDDALVAYDFQADDGVFETQPDSTATLQVTASPVTHNRSLSAAVGLPSELGIGQAARASNWVAGDFFEFSVSFGSNESEAIDVRLNSLQFWDRPDVAGALEQVWCVEVEIDGSWHELVLDSQLLVDNDFFAANNLPLDSSLLPLVGWRRNRFAFADETEVGYLTPSAQPTELRFRMYGETSAATRIDNLEVMGTVTNPCESEFESVSCSAGFFNDVLRFLDELGRPVELDIRGGGFAEAILGPPSDDVDPLPQELLWLELRDTNPLTTEVIVRWADGTTVNDASAPLRLGRVNFGAGVREFDASAVAPIAGTFESDGPLQSIRTNGIVAGSTLDLGGSPRDQLVMNIAGPVGNRNATEGVDLSFAGQVSVTSQGWYGGRWDVGRAGRVTAAGGDFSPSVNLQGGFESFTVRGGDFRSPTFRSGLAEGAGNGTGNSILASTDSRGIGGSIVTSRLEIDGNLTSLTASGGSLQTNLAAARVTSVEATRSPANPGSGSIHGTIQVQSLDRLVSVGGTISATLETFDTTHRNLVIESQAVGSEGGQIDSRYSFDIAGGIRQLVARDISLKLAVGGEIEQLVVSPGIGGTASRLAGELSSARIGQLLVTDGEIDFSLTITQPDSETRAAVESIIVPTPSLLQNRLRLPTNATIGTIAASRENPAGSGDVNRDGRLDVADVDQLCNWIGRNLPEADLNRDRQVDASDLDYLIELLWRTVPGDANLDGLFNSTDFVEVFLRGEYEDGIAGNSTWADGDWNCDGEFDSGDFIVAFLRGGYER